MAQGWQPLTTLDWKNSPDTTTPLNANNLNNKVSGFISELDERTRTLDNVKLDVNDAGGIVARAEDGAETSEAYAIGTRSGIPVTSDDPAYHNNSKYYSEQVGDEALKAEGYANGKQNGVPVGSSSPYYHNNAEYFKDQASQIAAQQLGALTDVDISSPQNGQVLTYDSNESKWVNGTGGGGGSSTLAGLSDVTLTTPSSDDILVYDGADWVNKAGGYVESSVVTFTNTDTLYQFSARFQDLATQALTYIQSLGNDEYVTLNSFYWASGGTPTTPLDPVLRYTNSISEFEARFGGYYYNAGTRQESWIRLHSVNGRSYYVSSDMRTTPSISITDGTSGTSSNTIELKLTLHKKI